MFPAHQSPTRQQPRLPLTCRPTQPTSPLHMEPQRELCQNKCHSSSFAIWGESGRGHFSKGWELLQSEALWSPQPSDHPLLSLPIPFSLLAHPVFPPDVCLPRIFSPASHLCFLSYNDSCVIESFVTTESSKL